MATYSTRIRVTLAGTDRPLPAVRVSLYDRDRYSADDLLGNGVTDGSGQALISYTAVDYADAGPFDDPRPGALPFLPDLLPDLYVAVHDDAGAVVLNTRSRTQENQHRRLIEVPVPRKIAEAHGLLKLKPRATQEEKVQDFERQLRDLTSSDGPGVLCMVQLILRTIASLEEPTTDLQTQAAKALTAQGGVDPTMLHRIGDLARQGHDHVASSPFIDGADCPTGDDPSQYAKMMLDLGRLASLQKALSAPVPAPDADLGEPTAGVPFADVWAWPDEKQVCVAKYLEGGIDDPLALQQFSAYYPDGVDVMAPPTINRVEVWDESFGVGQNVREADAQEKVLTRRVLDVRKGAVDWLVAEVPMSVPLDDETCFFNRADPTDDDRQILVVDVVPGQKVALRGSGFISETATLHVNRIPWTSDLVDDNGILQPATGTGGAVSGFDQSTVDVHGSADPPSQLDSPTTYTKDTIVFDWPEEAAAQGLYRVVVEFENPEGRTVRVYQDDTTCRLELDTRAHTAELYFAVLPVANPLRATFSASEVECVAVGPPPWWFDDVHYQASGAVERFTLNEDGSGGTFAPGAMRVPVSNGYKFFAPGVWVPVPPLRPIPAANATAPTLLFADVAVVELLLTEVLGDVDKALIAALSFVVGVVIAVIIAALALAVLALLVAGGWIVAATATPFIAPILTICFIVVLPAVSAAVGAVLLGVITAQKLGQVTTMLQGDEYAHRLSPVRLHRQLWARQRPSPGLDATLMTTVAQNGVLKETYRCRGLGADYRLGLSVEP